MTELKISNFNLAFFQKPKKPLPDEQFAEIHSTVLKSFPLADQISNPILTARRKEGGETFINPVFIQFTNIATSDFESDIKMIKKITDIYFLKYKTEKIHQIAFRLVSIIEASFQHHERLLIKNESLKLSPDTIKMLSSEKEIRIGVRLVFPRNGKRYELKIEPYFTNLEYNYIDFNVVVPNIEISPDAAYDLLQEEKAYFQRTVSSLMP